MYNGQHIHHTVNCIPTSSSHRQHHIFLKCTSSIPTLSTSHFVNSHFVNFPLRQFPLCQFPALSIPSLSIPSLSIPSLSIPTLSIPTLSTLTKWELTKWELTKWEVDQMGIDEVGIDKVGIDQVGRCHTVMVVLVYDPTFYDTLIPSCMSICIGLEISYVLHLCMCWNNIPSSIAHKNGRLAARSLCAFVSFIVIFFPSKFMLPVTSGCVLDMFVFPMILNVVWWLQGVSNCWTGIWSKKFGMENGLEQ